MLGEAGIDFRFRYASLVGGFFWRTLTALIFFLSEALDYFVSQNERRWFMLWQTQIRIQREKQLTYIEIRKMVELLLRIMLRDIQGQQSMNELKKIAR